MKTDPISYKNNIWCKAFDSISAMLLVVDTEGKAEYCNNSFRRYIRKPRSKILGNSLWEIILDLKEKPENCLLDAVELNKKRQFIELHVENKRLKIYADPILNDNKKLTNIIITISDVTEKYNNIKELEESENQYKDLVELANIAIGMDDTKGNLIYFNKQFSDLFGYTMDEMKKLSHKDLVHPDDIEAVRKIHKRRLQGDETNPRYEFRGIRKDGSIVFVDISVNEIIKSDGCIVGTRSYLFDISEKKKFIEELEIALDKARKSDQLKTAFIRNISHEIRTPLNGILGFSKLLIKEDTSDLNKKKYAEIIDISSDQLLRIIRDIIDISKIEIGDIKIQKREFNLNALMLYLFNKFEDNFKNEKINFKLNIPESEDSFTLYSDDEKIKQIVSNLLSNSLKFTDTGAIEFGFVKTKKNVEFYVKDTGIGIDQNFQEKIFEHFMQVESDSTRRYGGNGLGLSIARGFVEILGGNIWLTSEIGKGSTFYFTVPHSV